MISESNLHTIIPSIVKFEQGILRDLKIKYGNVFLWVLSEIPSDSASMHTIESSLWQMAYDKTAVTRKI